MILIQVFILNQIFQAQSFEYNYAIADKTVEIQESVKLTSP